MSVDGYVGGRERMGEEGGGEGGKTIGAEEERPVQADITSLS